MLQLVKSCPLPPVSLVHIVDPIDFVDLIGFVYPAHTRKLVMFPSLAEYREPGWVEEVAVVVDLDLEAVGTVVQAQQLQPRAIAGLV